jgi:HKD family nuclease
MAELDFILQAVTTANHAKALQALLALPNPNEVLVSVAFVREPGLEAVEAAIKPLATKTTFFIGIRNDITSIQAVKRLLAMKVKLYAVDTGSRGILFHPKLYMAASVSKASVIIGSANLTFGGLHNNIEVSTRVDLDFSNAADKKFYDAVTNAFAGMLKKHPQHVFLIKDCQHADELFDSGRLADETLIPAPSTTSSVKKGNGDDLLPMKLYLTPQPRIKIPVFMVVPATKSKKAAPNATPTLAPESTVRHLVWESEPLKRRDLNIPYPKSRHDKKTNPTGSILLKKGAFEDINPLTYFRDNLFAHLTWTSDPESKKPHLERAFEDFELVIKNVNCNVFKLKLTHDTRPESPTRKKGIGVTQIHWGDAKNYIRKEDLLKRTLYLYCKNTTPPEFTIEID